MATNTYVELDKITTTGSVASVTFSSINQGYTDLIIVAQVRGTATTYLNLRFNGDTGSNYSRTTLSGNGSSATSERRSNQTWINTDYNEAIQTNFNYVNILHIMNYSNTTTNKTVLCRANNAATGTGATVGLWRNTAAITSVSIIANNNTFDTGSTFSLYGVKAWANTEASPKAVGGYVYSDSNYWYHAFPYSSSFSPTQSVTADILVVAGGGAGGNAGDRGAGGGGAGGITYYASQALSATSYAVTVGAGGAPRLGGSYTGIGASGSNSQFASLTASVGGGGGGCENGGANNGGSGGSGGGGGAYTASVGSGGAATSAQGYAGGNAYQGSLSDSQGGGGGGFTAAGANAASYAPGAGGAGTSSYSSWGIATRTGHNVDGTYYFAGGGGGAGGGYSTSEGGRAFGGVGGGGKGSSLGNGIADSGIASTGGGGGAQSWNGTSGAGGSGVVIVRYAK